MLNVRIRIPIDLAKSSLRVVRVTSAEGKGDHQAGICVSAGTNARDASWTNGEGGAHHQEAILIPRGKVKVQCPDTTPTGNRFIQRA